MSKEILLTEKELLQRGWTKNKIMWLAPKPIYKNGVRLWKLSEIEKIESSISFYIN